MKLNKIFLITVILLAAFSISAINAEDAEDVIAADNDMDNVISASDVDVTGANSTEITKNTTIISDDLVKYYKNDSRFEVKLLDVNGTPLANATAQITLNGVTYNRTTDATGSTSIAVNLNSGNYSVKVTNTVTKEVVTNKIAVLSTIDGSDLVKYYKNATRYEVVALDFQGKPIVGKTVRYNVNGVYYNRTTDSKGVASLAINLNSGKYVITSENPVTGELVANNINVLSTINGTTVRKYYRNGTQYFVTARDFQGNPIANKDIKLNINGVYYNRTTDANGTAQLNINLQPGTYTLTAENPTTGEFASNTITVLSKLEVKNSASGGNISMQYNNNESYRIVVHNETGGTVSGADVVFNINGRIYHRTSDENGSVSLGINLVPGDYTITATYKDSTVSNLIKVRVSPNIKILNTTVKTNGIFSYYLTEEKTGNPIANHLGVFWYNGTTYGANSDSKGLVQFTIKLPAGSYMTIAGTLDDGYYSSKLIYNTVKVID